MAEIVRIEGQCIKDGNLFISQKRPTPADA